MRLGVWIRGLVFTFVTISLKALEKDRGHYREMRNIIANILLSGLELCDHNSSYLTMSSWDILEHLVALIMPRLLSSLNMGWKMRVLEACKCLLGKESK